ncbi:MAG: PepSY-like domain-containing protein [Saprospiraceae bacterium]
MYKHILMLLLISCAFCMNAQKINEKAVPEAVKSEFKSKYPSVSKVKWEKEELNFEAEFEINKVESSVVLDGSGKILEIESEISQNQLPGVVQSYLKKNHSGEKIKEVAKITDSNGVVTYEVEIKSGDKIFDTDGNLIVKK